MPDSAGYINLADALHHVGRSDEARAVARGPAERRPATAAAATGSALEAEIALDTRRLGDAARHLPDRRRPTRHELVNFALRHAELALADGDTPTARALARRRRRRSPRLDEPQFLGWRAPCAPSSSAAPATSTPPARRSAALDRIESCTDDLVRLARVAAVGVVVEADAAQRACDLGDDEAERRGVCPRRGLPLAAPRRAAEDGGPVEEAWLRSAEAEHARAGGKTTRRAHEAAAEAWEAVRALPGRAHALARGRGARRRAATATAPPRRSRALADRRRLGAGWLRGEIEGLAAPRAAALPTARRGRRRAPRAGAREDPFGLTPRERQVLALVAEGRTNREIGAPLFMAEKTASVHVSRILSKLDVRSRTEAAAVAHRLGLGALPKAVASSPLPGSGRHAEGGVVRAASSAREACRAPARPGSPRAPGRRYGATEGQALAVVALDAVPLKRASPRSCSRALFVYVASSSTTARKPNCSSPIADCATQTSVSKPASTAVPPRSPGSRRRRLVGGEAERRLLDHRRAGRGALEDRRVGVAVALRALLDDDRGDVQQVGEARHPRDPPPVSPASSPRREEAGLRVDDDEDGVVTRDQRH